MYTKENPFCVVDILVTENNPWIDHFAYSWINSKVNGNHEIVTQKWKMKISPPPGFEPQYSGTKRQCATLELCWPLFVYLQTSRPTKLYTSLYVYGVEIWQNKIMCYCLQSLLFNLKSTTRILWSTYNNYGWPLTDPIRNLKILLIYQNIIIIFFHSLSSLLRELGSLC